MQIRFIPVLYVPILSFQERDETKEIK